MAIMIARIIYLALLIPTFILLVRAIVRCRYAETTAVAYKQGEHIVGRFIFILAETCLYILVMITIKT